MQDFKHYPNYELFKNKTILSIDFGEKVIGLATFTPGREPYPISRGRIINSGLEHFFKEIAQIIEDDFVEVIIFGIAYLTDGTETDKTRELKSICDAVREKFQDVLVIEQDETLTTVTAKERMLNSAEYNFTVDPKKIDEVSAIIILEDFIRKI
ncbi:Holliday junction resolvase RuvX [Bacteriovorax sp. Seq25_V]|uniref:Holliday junction resolvase RuvX n=1 Tax=Bacteriovorax sp. Seq25_V TaxID=1201288 RepID=UPI00038A3224|nr:Holliday junction resolvase RuvX [Bacteriovorax sp. Seq25_V]EQC47096.1 RNAse H domain protein, YqgF family [Bacteriovorax sp. Seq25_V]